MVPQKVNFWSISCKKRSEAQQKHALRKKFWWTHLCSNDILNPGYKRKRVIRKRTFILDKTCFENERLFHPVQCTTCKIYHYSSIDKLVLPSVSGFLWYTTIFNLSEASKSSLELVSSMSGNCCISTRVSVKFSGESFAAVSTTW